MVGSNPTVSTTREINMFTDDKKKKLEELLNRLQGELGLSDAIIRTIRGLLSDWLRIH